MLTVKEVIQNEFKSKHNYALREVFNIFSQIYNISKEEFKFIGYGYDEIIEILENGKIGEKSNDEFFLRKVDIWNLFLYIADKIELNSQKVEKKECIKLIKKNKKSMKMLKDSKKGTRLLIDAKKIEDIILLTFSEKENYIILCQGENSIDGILAEYSVENGKKENEFFVEVNNIDDIFYKVFDYRKIEKEVFYTIKDLEQRLTYPADLNNYYIDDSIIYHCENEWIKFSPSQIKEIIKKDYEGTFEFFKFGSWKIYGSDEEFKDRYGKHSISLEDSNKIRPDGYCINKGKLQYLMNSTYCRYLMYELEHRLLKPNYKFSVKELEEEINKLSKEKIIDYSKNILCELNSSYIEDINKIRNDNKRKLQEYKHVLELIKKGKQDKIIENVDGYLDLESLINKLEMIEYKNTSRDILKNIKTLLEEDSRGYSTKIAKKLYNKQATYNENIRELKKISYELQGECSKKVNEIYNNLITIRKSIKDEFKLSIFDLYFSFNRDNFYDE